MPLPLLGAIGGAKTVFIGLAALAIVTVVGAAAVHYNGLVADLATAKANEATLQTALDEQSAALSVALETNKDWADWSVRVEERMQRLTELTFESNEYTRRLSDVLSKHNLEALSLAKPGLIERRINDGTAAVFSMFERETRTDPVEAGGGREAAGDDSPPAAPAD